MLWKKSLAWAVVTGAMLLPALAEQPQVAMYGYHSEVTVFWDPAYSFSNEIIWMHNVYETLLRYDPFTDQFQPVLAESYERSEDGLTWTFYLRQGVRFHTGREMDAEAVKGAIERTISLGKGAWYIWDAVESIEAVDDYTVAFHLKYPAPMDLTVAACYSAFIFDPAYDHDWYLQGHDSGTGPYTIERFEGNTLMVLEKFEGYWGGWEGNHFDKVVFKTVPSPSTLRLMVESGQVDIAYQLPVSDIQALKDNPNVRIVHTPSFQNLLALFNTQKPPLDNPLVRRALAYTIPYQDIIQGVLAGYGRQARGVVPYGLWGWSDRVKQYTLSLETAKVLLSEAGYPEGGFKLLLTYVSADENERRVAELWKSQLAKLGIELEARGMPWDSQWELGQAPDPTKRQDIFLFYWWPDYAHPHSFLSAMFQTEEEIVFNLCYYSNPLYDGLITRAAELAGIDRAESINMYVEAQNVLMEDVPGISIYDVEYVRAVNANLQGYVDNPAYPHVVWWYSCWRG
ncbi:ABC transporter substrate-binding protein [Candidatus Bipolaricaulota bacterium]|nr:ABC transporter substrate-binding protein [Candidatus Bipolaricaulota bacterium]